MTMISIQNKINKVVTDFTEEMGMVVVVVVEISTGGSRVRRGVEDQGILKVLRNIPSPIGKRIGHQETHHPVFIIYLIIN